MATCRQCGSWALIPTLCTTCGRPADATQAPDLPYMHTYSDPYADTDTHGPTGTYAHQPLGDQSVRPAPAGWARRGFAWAFDYFVSMFAGITLGIVLMAVVTGNTDPNDPRVELVWLGIALSAVFYWWLPTALTGQTFGKVLFGLRVVRADNPTRVPGFGVTALRCLVATVLFAIPLGAMVNFILTKVDVPEHRAIHDRAAKTRVVRVRR